MPFRGEQAHLKRVKELDGLRAVAVSLVILDHCSTMLPAGYPFGIGVLFPGALGVTIFLVLSGYLITRLLNEERATTGSIGLSAFYWRRLIRIVPASYAYLAFVTILTIAGLADVSVGQLLGAYLHLWNYAVMLLPAGQPAQGADMLGHFWSLALEEQFYWIWPLVLGAAYRRARRVLIAVILLAPLFRLASYALFPDTRGFLTMMFHTACDPLAMGCLLALCEQRLRVWVDRADSRTMTCVLAALFLAVPHLHAFGRSYWTITYGKTIDSALAAAVILILVHRPDHWFAGVMRLRPIQFVGAISFSLYLWQQMFCFRGAALAMAPLFAIPCALLVATASYYAIERPFQRLRHIGPGAAKQPLVAA